MGGVSSRLYRNQTGSEFGKRIRWAAESKLDPNVGAHLATRNSLMNEPVANLANPYPNRTDILHEYFVVSRQVRRVPARLPGGHPARPRRVPQRDAALRRRRPVCVLAHSPEPRIAAVMSFSQEISPEGEVDMMRLTERLIDRIVAIGGAFYLPYRLHARRDQVTGRLCESALLRRAQTPTRSRPPVPQRALGRLFRMSRDMSRNLPRYAALALGLALMFAAATDYVPAFLDAQGRVFGLFHLDIYKDALHVASALWAFAAAAISRRAAWLFLALFGALYLIDGLIGVATGSGYLDLSLFIVGVVNEPFLIKLLSSLPHVGLGLFGIASAWATRR